MTPEPNATSSSELAGAPIDLPETWERAEVLAFSGGGGEHFWKLWSAGKTGINAGAFLFSFAWFAYRKMCGAAFLVLAGIVAWALAPGSGGSSSFMGPVVGVLTGYLGGLLYRRKARAAIAEAHERHPTSCEARCAWLKKRGGTNLVAGLVAGALLVASAAATIWPLLSQG